MQAMTAALKIVLEFALDIARQFPALLRQMSRSAGGSSAGGGYTSNSWFAINGLHSIIRSNLN
jgi:hypothetical protein